MSRGFRGIQPLVGNPLRAEPSSRSLLCGLIGDHPSRYSRSPALWNAAFRALDLDAIYVPLDVTAENLPALISACRVEPRFIGANVTVPYKQAVIPLLDALDASAELVGAVNTIARTPDGWLVGANTDGRGAVDSLIHPWPGAEDRFLPSLEHRSILLIGAGGAGRAVAFALARAIGPRGRLFVANRTPETALELGAAVAAVSGNAQGLDESDAELLAPGIDLIVNTSSRGQSGPFPAPGGRIAYLEPYSALGPADPPSIPNQPGESERDHLRAWLPAAVPSIQANHAASLRFVLQAAPHAHFFDLVYAPSETIMLRHARWAGHPTLNGQGMILFQAAAAFCDFVVRPKLDRRGLDPASTRDAMVEAMATAWGAA